VGGVVGGGWGRGGMGDSDVTHYTLIAFNKADFTNFRNTR